MKILKVSPLILLIVILAAFVPVMAVTNFGAVHIKDSSATGVPALRVDQQGAGKIVEFLDGGTPVFSINNGGAVTGGKVLANPTAGLSMNCQTSTITDSVTYTATVTAISTPAWGVASLRSISGDAARVAINVATPGSVLITVRNSNATPAANAAGAVVNWCVGGTPQ